MLINTYFAFTTLATVGFGDYYPVSAIERAIFTMVFLFGVALVVRELFFWHYGDKTTVSLHSKRQNCETILLV